MTLNKSEFLFSWSLHSKDGSQTIKTVTYNMPGDDQCFEKYSRLREGVGGKYHVWEANIYVGLIFYIGFYTGKACVMEGHLSRIWRTCGRAKWISGRKRVLVPGKWSNQARALQGEWA